jgi:hypothetical protein
MPCAVLVVMCYDSLRACILASLFFSLTGSSAAGSGLNICSWCFHHFLSSACIVHFVLEVALVTTNYLHSRFVLLDEICCQLGVSRAIAVQVVVKWLHSRWHDGYKTFLPSFVTQMVVLYCHGKLILLVTVSMRDLWSSRRCSMSVYFTLGYNVLCVVSWKISSLNF